MLGEQQVEEEVGKGIHDRVRNVASIDSAVLYGMWQAYVNITIELLIVH